MEITYLGHTSFRLKGKNVTVVTDPYEKSVVGFTMPKAAADVVTVSSPGSFTDETNLLAKVTGTSRREKPYLIKAPGEYEVGGVGCFGWRSGTEVKNTMYSIMVDGVSVCHLGLLKEKLNDDQINGLGVVDVWLLPVGDGGLTLSTEAAAEVIQQLQPSWVIPMHYLTPTHNPDKYSQLKSINDFLKEVGEEGVKEEEKLVVKAGETTEESEVVVLKKIGEEG